MGGLFWYIYGKMIFKRTRKYARKTGTIVGSGLGVAGLVAILCYLI